MTRQYDAIVIGSGPNGLAAAIVLAEAGLSVLVREGSATIGGGTRTAELTLRGFHHDVCSAAHTMGILSPLFRRLELARHGLTWIRPPAAAAHPLDDEPAAMLWHSLEQTAEELGADRRAYRRLVAPFLDDPHALLGDLLAPLGIPSHPIRMARFGLTAIRSATSVAYSKLSTARARALFAGCAAHAIQPLEHRATAAFGLLFLLTGHVEPWPIAAGGSERISAALASVLTSLGGTIEVGRPVRVLSDLPPSSVVLFDTSPRALAEIAGEQLPPFFRARLERFRYGPGVFKVDWALSEPIPWADPQCRFAATVHVGGRLEEIAAAEAAVWRGEHPDRPYMIVCQQSLFDTARAPVGRHTGYAYCHVPSGSTVDLTAVVERQMERFAPGFRDTILARHTLTTAQFASHNPNYIGGAITGGVADLTQLFTRPVLQRDPYRTPNPRLFLCSASTPPGGGVHGMCGDHAARSVLRDIHELTRVSW